MPRIGAMELLTLEELGKFLTNKINGNTRNTKRKIEE
jgi:hypothetical protein